MGAIMLAGALTMAWLMMAHAPEAPISPLLRTWLVDWPARKLLHVERRHLIFLLVAAISAQALLAVGLPDIGMVVAWDVSTYLDLLLVTWTLTAVTNLKAAGRLTAARWRRLTGGARRTSPHPRSKRPARRSTPAPSANDDDRPAFALAA